MSFILLLICHQFFDNVYFWYLGKGIAALTLDDDYQRKRRDAMNRKPADGLETIARGTKGVVTVSNQNFICRMFVLY